MQRFILTVMAVALVVLVGMSVYRQQRAHQPRPGDTVTPVLIEAPGRTAGGAGWPAVYLQAQGPDDPAPRSLAFIRGVPATVNPVARITFFDDERQLGSTAEIELTHRC